MSQPDGIRPKVHWLGFLACLSFGQANEMKLPPDVQFHSDVGLLLWHPTGVLTQDRVDDIVAFVAALEILSDGNERRFIDTTLLVAVDLNFRYVFDVALYRRLTRADCPGIKSAFLIADSSFAHYFKLHAVLTDHSSLQVRLFEERELAAKWLDVPAELLAVT
ncbi:MAG: hypothetical protein ACJ8KU_10175 [Chthoniobacterales bacterium]